MTEEMSRVQRNAQTSRKQPKKNSSKAKRYAKYTILTLATLGVVGALGGAGVFRITTLHLLQNHQLCLSRHISDATA